MHRSNSGISPKAIGWALLSQVFWVPLVAIDLHDRWVARQREITPPGQPLQPSPIARATPFSLNDLLGAARPVRQLAGQANQAVSGAFGSAVRGAASGVGVLLSSAGSSASSLLDRPFTVSVDAPAASASGSGVAAAAGSPQVAPLEGLGMLGRAFTRAQLLGGSISLADLQEGPMAPLALAERALQRGSNDPLSPLPTPWREPMRQALLKLPSAPQQLSPARLVYVPSSTLSQPVEVPLALQSDGSVDILELPKNPGVLREIESWSRQQRPPAIGSLLPALVHLHPLPAVAPITPAASPSRPAAASAPAPRPAAANRVSTTRSAPRVAVSTPAPACAKAVGVKAGGSAADLAPLSISNEAALAKPAASTEAIPVPLRSEAPAPATIPVPILSETPASAPAEAPVAAAPQVEAPAPVAEAATIPVPITSESMPSP